MQIEDLDLTSDINAFEMIVRNAFAQTLDSNMSDWFSIAQMKKSINEGYGICLKVLSDHKIIGVIHAQKENLINGREGEEKWVITNLAVNVGNSGQGYGSALISEMERRVKKEGAIKMFVHTNENDERVIHFYEKNGYKWAGNIQDYYYAGSAVFLVKHLH